MGCSGMILVGQRNLLPQSNKLIAVTALLLSQQEWFQFLLTSWAGAALVKVGPEKTGFQLNSHHLLPPSASKAGQNAAAGFDAALPPLFCQGPLLLWIVPGYGRHLVEHSYPDLLVSKRQWWLLGQMPRGAFCGATYRAGKVRPENAFNHSWDRFFPLYDMNIFFVL